MDENRSLNSGARGPFAMPAAAHRPHWALYRFTTKLRAQKPLLDACLGRVLLSLHEVEPSMGEELAIDATDLPASTNGQEYGLAPLRVRGLEKVALHADLTMLARLSLALAQARAIPLAA
jgi:hypothetical protein